MVDLVGIESGGVYLEHPSIIMASTPMAPTHIIIYSDLNSRISPYSWYSEWAAPTDLDPAG